MCILLPRLFVDKDGDCECDSLLVVVIVLSVIAVVAIIAGVILLILYIKQRTVIKRSCRLYFYVLIAIMEVYFTVFGEISSRKIYSCVGK